MKLLMEVGYDVFADCASATLEQVDLLQALYDEHAPHMTTAWKENLLGVIHLTQSHAAVLFEQIMTNKGGE